MRPWITKHINKKEKIMITFILLGYVAVIVISYKGAVVALDKSGLL